MKPVPWNRVNSWQCTGCGLCCKKFDVVLKFNEWLGLVQRYGVGATCAGLNKLLIGRNPDGSCFFLNDLGNISFCGLQNMKPMACKLWPFKIIDNPKYGRPKEAIFNYRERRFFVYIDPFCPEISWGKPSSGLVSKTIPEFIELALGFKYRQFYTTGNSFYTSYPKINKGYRIF